MKIIVKHVAEPVGHIMEIPNTLVALQDGVGGYIETVTLKERPDVCILCDDEGRLKLKMYNCTAFGVNFVGTILVVGTDGDEFTDCPMTLEEWEGMLS